MSQIKKDCFGYNEITEACKCLKKLYCQYEECHFYKPKKDKKGDKDETR